jgi:hypothetical protein
MRRGDTNAGLLTAMLLPCHAKLEQALSRALMRVGEWLQEIAHLNIFVHAQNMLMIEPATSLQLGHKSFN